MNQKMNMQMSRQMNETMDKSIKQHYHSMDKERGQAVAEALLLWYDQHKRELPWRLTKDPYAIWISEIMAQQTRITALLPYYERFMKRLPTAAYLAAADVDEVLKLWEGLGYYARARNLHKAAGILVSQYEGRMPPDMQALIKLPGIGAYTAGAIMSIAFDAPVPAVDGNVLRVFARVEDNHMDIADTATRAALAKVIADIMPAERASCFNQSLMELGALVCLPKNPLCQECPLYDLCRARLAGTQRQLPVKSPKKAAKTLDKTFLLLISPEGELLMRKRTERLLHGLWEPYSVDMGLGRAESLAHAGDAGLWASRIKDIGGSRHIFTHLIWEMTGYAIFVREKCGVAGYEWVTKAMLEAMAVPTAVAYYVNWFVENA